MGALHDFQESIMRNELVDAGFIGDSFTWCNNCRGHGRIWGRLDRALFSLQFQSDFSDFSVHHLDRISSDHSPLLMSFESTCPRTSSRFIFQRMCVDHPNFMTLVATSWSKQIHGSPGWVFWRKLMRLKHSLRAWNWSTFGDIFKKKKELQDRVQQLELELQQG